MQRHYVNIPIPGTYFFQASIFMFILGFTPLDGLAITYILKDHALSNMNAINASLWYTPRPDPTSSP